MAKGQRVGSSRVAPYSLEQVVEAVESLYQDQLRPHSRILRARLKERVGSDCDTTQLRELCNACPRLYMESEDRGGEWTAFLAGDGRDLIDIYSKNEEIYPKEMWELLASESLTLTGGRYASAVALAERGLHFLQEYSLGQLCHIIELAICKKILGYRDGNVVNYIHSKNYEKDVAANSENPVHGEKKGLRRITWGSAPDKLREMLQEKRVERMPIANVKRVFREKRWAIDFSETALGYSRVSDLLQDFRFAHVCKVECQEKGYVVSLLPGDSPHACGCIPRPLSCTLMITVSVESAITSDLVAELTLSRDAQIYDLNQRIQTETGVEPFLQHFLIDGEILTGLNPMDAFADVFRVEDGHDEVTISFVEAGGESPTDDEVTDDELTPTYIPRPLLTLPVEIVDARQADEHVDGFRDDDEFVDTYIVDGEYTHVNTPSTSTSRQAQIQYWAPTPTFFDFPAYASFCMLGGQ